MKPKLAPATKSEKLRTLWKASLRVGTGKDEFLFRSTEEFTQASRVAQDLLDSSPSCQITGAVIVAVER